MGPGLDRNKELNEQRSFWVGAQPYQTHCQLERMYGSLQAVAHPDALTHLPTRITNLRRLAHRVLHCATLLGERYYTAYRVTPDDDEYYQDGGGEQILKYQGFGP